MLVITFGVIAWLGKALLNAYELRVKEQQAAHDAHLATAMQVVPLATNLVHCIEILERLSNRVGGA